MAHSSLVGRKARLLYDAANTHEWLPLGNLRSAGHRPRRYWYVLLSQDLVLCLLCLIPIDEAHRGSGDYSYAQIIRYMMAKNPYFRVLGLTATPGSDPEAVQTIVDCLHISHIEIRDEQSMDLRPYLHKKVLQQHFLPMSREIVKIRDLLSKIMQVKVLPNVPMY